MPVFLQTVIGNILDFRVRPHPKTNLLEYNRDIPLCHISLRIKIMVGNSFMINQLETID